jgi:anti-anti-sigma regulatory factor
MVPASIQHEDRGEIGIVRIPMCAIDEQAAVTIEQACAEMRPVTALDFRNVRFINSGGLASLLKFSVAARKKGYKLFAINLSAHHQKMFKQVEIARFMPIITEHELLGSERATLLNVATEIPAAP